MANPAWLLAEVGGNGGSACQVEVHAVPGSRREGFAGVHGDRLKIRVSAPPEGGRANAAIRRLLAEGLGLSERGVELVRGEASRRKSFRVALDAATVAARLGPVV